MTDLEKLLWTLGVIQLPKRRKISIGVGVIVIKPPALYPVLPQMLVTRRKKGSIAMPGGHIEEYEAAYDCAVREVKEETGLNIKPKLIDGHTYIVHAEEWFRQGKHHWTLYMAANVISGELCNNEPHKHEPWRWETLDNLEKICGPKDWIPLTALKVNREKIGL